MSVAGGRGGSVGGWSAAVTRMVALAAGAALLAGTALVATAPVAAAAVERKLRCDDWLNRDLKT